MANSALLLTEQGPTQDSGYRVRRGFTQCVWERTFGTNNPPTIATGINCATADSLWDQTAVTGAGFWPRIKNGFPTWKGDRLPGNAEMHENRHLGMVLRDGNNVALTQALLGQPHAFGTDYIELRALTSCTTDQEVVDSYVENTDTTVSHNLNNTQTVTCEIPAGRQGFTVGKKLYIINRLAAAGGTERGCGATVVSYSGTTLVATSSGAPINMITGSYTHLGIIQRNFEAGMLITRANLPPVVDNCYWEVEQQIPDGAGHVSAHWWIHEDQWPPEVDGHEHIESADVINTRAHAGFISNVSGTSISQRSRLYSAWSTSDSTGALKYMNWGTNLVDSFHLYGTEWGPNFLAHTLDDALTRSEFYRWIAEGNQNNVPVGQFSFAPRFELYYAIGWPTIGYRPLTFNKFFQGGGLGYRIKSARVWVRP